MLKSLILATMLLSNIRTAEMHAVNENYLQSEKIGGWYTEEYTLQPGTNYIITCDNKGTATIEDDQILFIIPKK